MSWIGLLLVAIGLYLAFKVAGALLKLLMWIVVLVGGYWFVAPYLGWPSPSELFYVLGPDLGSKRIEEIVDPENAVREVGARVADQVVETLGGSVDRSTEQGQAGSGQVDSEEAHSRQADYRQDGDGYVDHEQAHAAGNDPQDGDRADTTGSR